MVVLSSSGGIQAPACATGRAERSDGREAIAVAFHDAEERLLSLLHALMWRHSKDSVIDQLDLPPQVSAPLPNGEKAA